MCSYGTAWFGHSGIQGQISDHDLAEVAIPEIPLGRPGRGGGFPHAQQPAIVRPIQHHRMACALGMPRDADPTREDLIVVTGFLHVDGRPDILHGDGIARGRDGDERIGWDSPQAHPFVVIGGPPTQGRECLPSEPLKRPLMSRPMDSLIGHRHRPLLQPGVQGLPGGKAAASQGIALHICHAAFDFALRLRPIRLTGSRREAIAPRKILPDWMPEHAALAPTHDERPRVIVQTLQRHAAKMLEGPLMPIEQRTEPFMRIGRRPQSAGVPEREHKDVEDFQPVANPEAGLAKVHLGLLARVRLKPHRRHGRPRSIEPKRLNRPLHLLIGPRKS